MIITANCLYFLDYESTMETDDTLEGAVGGESEHHTSQEQTDLESDSKGNIFNLIWGFPQNFCLVFLICTL